MSSVFKAEIIGDLNTEGPNIYDVPFEDTPAAHALKAVGVSSFAVAGGGLTTVSGGIGVFLRSILVRSIPALAAGCIEDRGMVGDDGETDATIPNQPNNKNISSACKNPESLAVSDDGTQTLLPCNPPHGDGYFELVNDETKSYFSMASPDRYVTSTIHEHTVYMATITGSVTSIHVVGVKQFSDSSDKKNLPNQTIELDAEAFTRTEGDVISTPSSIEPVSLKVIDNNLYILAKDGSGAPLMARYEISNDGKLINSPVTYTFPRPEVYEPIAFYPLYNANGSYDFVILNKEGSSFVESPRVHVIAPEPNRRGEMDIQYSFSLGQPPENVYSTMLPIYRPPSTLIEHGGQLYLITLHAEPGAVAVVNVSDPRSQPQELTVVDEDSQGKIQFVEPYPDGRALLIVTDQGRLFKKDPWTQSVAEEIQIDDEVKSQLAKELGYISDDDDETRPLVVSVLFIDDSTIGITLLKNNKGMPEYRRIAISSR